MPSPVGASSWVSVFSESEGDEPPKGPPKRSSTLPETQPQMPGPAPVRGFKEASQYLHPAKSVKFKTSSEPTSKEKMRDDLLAATESGDRERALSAARAMVDAKMDCGKFGHIENGNSALHYAARRGMPDVIELLANNTEHIDLPNDKGFSALSMAAWKGHPKVAEKLLDAGAEINHADKRGRTPLMLAVAYKRDDVARLLINYGADLDLRGPDNLTALMGAAYRGRVEVLKAMLDEGADMSLVDDNDMTALDWAREGGNQGAIAVLEGERPGSE